MKGQVRNGIVVKCHTSYHEFSLNCLIMSQSLSVV